MRDIANQVQVESMFKDFDHIDEKDICPIPTAILAIGKSILSDRQSIRYWLFLYVTRLNAIVIQTLVALPVKIVYLQPLGRLSMTARSQSMTRIAEKF